MPCHNCRGVARPGANVAGRPSRMCAHARAYRRPYRSPHSVSRRREAGTGAGTASVRRAGGGLSVGSPTEPPPGETISAGATVPGERKRIGRSWIERRRAGTEPGGWDGVTGNGLADGARGKVGPRRRRPEAWGGTGKAPRFGDLPLFRAAGLVSRLRSCLAHCLPVHIVRVLILFGFDVLLCWFSPGVVCWLGEFFGLV